MGREVAKGLKIYIIESIEANHIILETCTMRSSMHACMRNVLGMYVD